METLRDLFPDLDILDLLGAGGMGAVYKARQPRLNRLAALKIMVCPPGQEADFALRFEREAQVLARLNHPHIVVIYDFGDIGPERTGADPLFYFLMEFVDGTDLGQLIKSKELTPAQALAIVPQICEALQYAHDQGITHRDIKPANILIDKKGTVKIADFGLAKMIGSGGSEEALMTGLTQTGTAMGTPHYMAPEQWEHPEQVDHRADIYALGVVFYEMLTGERPAGVFEPPSKKSIPPVDKKFDSVVLRAMEKDPARRYQQAGQIGDDVTRISGAHKRHQSSAQGVLPRASKRNTPWIVLSLMLLLGLGGYLLWPHVVPDSKTKQPPNPGDAHWINVDFTEADPASFVNGAQLEGHQLRLQHGAWYPAPDKRFKNVAQRVTLTWRENTENLCLMFGPAVSGDEYHATNKHYVRMHTSNFGNRYCEIGYLTDTNTSLTGSAKPVDLPINPGDRVVLLFATLGEDHYVSLNGKWQYAVQSPLFESPAGYETVVSAYEASLDKYEYLPLDGLSKADALRVLGIDNAMPATTTAPPQTALAGPSALPSAKPGRLRAAGVSKDGKPHDLTRFAAYSDFVDVVGGRDRTVALRANGETVSHDGKSDLKDIRQIVKATSLLNDYAFISTAGKLIFRAGSTNVLPAALEKAVVVDAALGSSHGLALTDAGVVVPFGLRYQEAVDDSAESWRWGSPRWPQPPDQALQKVKAVAATTTHAATLHHDGSLSVWGWAGLVKWTADPQQKPAAHIASSEDDLWILDEAGQVFQLPLPRNPSPKQPVSSPGLSRLVEPGRATRLGNRWWLLETGEWRLAEPDFAWIFSENQLPPDAVFSLVTGGFPEKDQASLLWIEPVATVAAPAAAAPVPPALGGPSAPPEPSTLPGSPQPRYIGRLRGAGIHENGKPLDMTNAEGITDFVQVILTNMSWVGLRANGEQVTPEGGWGEKDVARLLIGFFNSYGTINRKGHLSIRMESTKGVKAIPEEVQRIGVVNAHWNDGCAIALLKDGTARVWGEVYQHSHKGMPIWPMPPAEALRDVIDIAAPRSMTATLTADGRLHSWGGDKEVGHFVVTPAMGEAKLEEIEPRWNWLWVRDAAGFTFQLPQRKRTLGAATGRDILDIASITALPRQAKAWTWFDPLRTNSQAEVDALLKQIGNRPRDAFDLRVVGPDEASTVAAVWIEPVAEAPPAAPAASAWVDIDQPLLAQGEAKSSAGGWLLLAKPGPQGGRIVLKGHTAHNAGLRGRFHGADFKDSNAPYLRLRASGPDGRSGGIQLHLDEEDQAPTIWIKRFSTQHPEGTDLLKRPLTAPLPPDREYTLELYLIGSQIIARCNQELFQVALDQESADAGQTALIEHLGPDRFRDLQFINLDDVSDTEALKLWIESAAAH